VKGRLAWLAAAGKLRGGAGAYFHDGHGERKRQDMAYFIGFFRSYRALRLEAHGSDVMSAFELGKVENA
jgi:hypothetical protein